MVDIQLITTTDGDPNNPDNIVVANLHDQALKPAPGGSKTLNATYELPTGLDTNDYFLMTVVTSDDITEKDVINNSFVTTDAVSVGEGTIDMMGQFGETTLPSAVIASEASTGKVSVTITNDGNTPDTGTVKGWMCVLRSETGSEVRGQRS